jgi:uncharacterized NAD(P)/FAD-binding protein YdhS
MSERTLFDESPEQRLTVRVSQEGLRILMIRNLDTYNLLVNTVARFETFEKRLDNYLNRFGMLASELLRSAKTGNRLATSGRKEMSATTKRKQKKSCRGKVASARRRASASTLSNRKSVKRVRTSAKSKARSILVERKNPPEARRSPNSTPILEMRGGDRKTWRRHPLYPRVAELDRVGRKAMAGR